MRLTHPLSILVLSLPLAACQNAPTVACGDPSGVDTVKTLIADAAQQAAQGQAEGKSSSIRTALSRFEVEFSAVRTDKKDPDSSKVFCAAQISVRLDPAVLLTLEAEAKAIPSVGSLDRLAEQRGFERAANVFTKRDFSYSLQPTDDGTMVFAESSDHQPSTLLSDLALLDVVRTEKASRPAVNVQSELARIQAEQAKVQAAGQQLAANQQALATIQQQQLAAASSPGGSDHPLFSAVDARIEAGGDPGTKYVNSPRDGFLSMRSHPSVKEGKRLIKIPHGAEITLFDCPATPRTTVDGVSGHWCTAEYGGHRGFVFDAYLGR